MSETPRAQDGSDALASLEVLSGSPSPEELAAVVAVLRSHADAAVTETPASSAIDDSRRSWNQAARGIGVPLRSSRNAWRRSLR